MSIVVFCSYRKIVAKNESQMKIPLPCASYILKLSVSKKKKK